MDSIVHGVKSAVFVSRQKLMEIIVTEGFTLTWYFINKNKHAILVTQ